MRKSVLLALPLLALVQIAQPFPVFAQSVSPEPAGSQQCDAMCEEELAEYQQDDVLYGKRPPPSEALLNEIVLIEPGPKDWIVVSGGHLSKPLSEWVIPVTYIDGPEQNTGQRVETIIRAIPGWQQFRRSDARTANPTSQGLTSRGLGGNASSRALLTLDGIPQTDPFGGWVNWTAFDAVALRGIRIENGGGSGAEGAGALAGTIQLSSVRWPEHFGSVSYGSRNSVDVDVSSGANIGEGHLMLSGNYSRGDGFVPIIAAQRGAVDGKAGYESFGGGLRVVLPLTSGGSNGPTVEANIRGFDDRRSRGLPFSDNRNSGVDASLRLLKNDGAMDVLALAYVQIRDFSAQFNSIAAGRGSASPTLDQYAVPSTGIGARIELRPQIGKASQNSYGDDRQLRLGIDWRRTVGRTRENSNFVAGLPTRYREAGGSTDTLGAYAETTALLDRLSLTASGRVDHWVLAQGRRYEANIGGSVRSDDHFPKREGWETTGRVGASWMFVDPLSLKAAAYKGWRLPTLNELYRPFRVGADATAANEALKPERLKGAQIALESHVEKIDFSLTAFVNWLDGAIANVTLGQGPGVFPGVGFVAAGGTYRQRQNLDAIRSKGIEADFAFALSDNLKLHTAYSYVDARVRGVAGLNGKRPAQVPKHNASGGFRFGDKAGLGGSAALRYTSSAFEDDANLLRLDNALTVDAALRYRFAGNWQIDLRAENLLSARVEAAISSAGIIERAAPRTLWLGLSAKFD
jgi:vitamin B12 transporter